MRIPILDLKAQYQQIGAEVMAAVRAVFESQQFIMGPEVAALEKEIAGYCDSRYGISCASGSDALLLALMALDVGPGDEVLTTPFTFFATGGSIVRLGARPVFVDIEPDTFNIDPGLIEGAITAKTKVILPVDLFGQCADMDPILATARGKGIAVIEDSAQAIGATYRGRRAGSLGVIGTISFYPTKNLGGAGDGGLMTTSDPEIADKLRALTAHGSRTKYYHDYVGFNSRLDAIQAAVLRVKLRYLDAWAARRRDNAHRYGLLFAESRLVSDGLVKLPAERQTGTHVYNQFVVRAKERDELRAFLEERGVGTEIYYPVPLHLQKCFSDLSYRRGSLPESERAADEALALPIYPELDEAAQHFVVDSFVEFYSRR